MEFIKNYLEAMPDIHRLLLLIFTLSFFWYVEKLNPFKKGYSYNKHLITNSLFSLTAIPIQVLFGLGILMVTSYNLKANSGLIHFNFIANNDSLILQLMISFIALDFLEYVYHVLMHHVKSLWMMHVVHHSDKRLDISSTLREHPFETFVRLSFLVIFLFLTGTEYWMLMFRQAIQIVFNVFSHSNYLLPKKVNTMVSYIFVTPNFHHVHHHDVIPYTDSNYGDILTVWDRIFGTFSKLGPKNISYGIDSFPEVNEKTKFKYLLKIPLKKYR